MKINLTKEELELLLSIIDDWWLEFSDSLYPTKIQEEVSDICKRIKLYMEDIQEKEKKYKILDQLAEEAEESRSEYRRWKNEKDSN